MSKLSLTKQLRIAQQLAQMRQTLGHSSPETCAAASPISCIKECEKSLKKVLEQINAKLGGDS